MDFDAAFSKLLQHEGGYSDHASDPGGKTRWGVTDVVAREAGYKGDMRDLPLDFAKSIYRQSYWNPIRANELPPGVRYAVFDAAVNSGVGQAIRWLQRAVGVLEDGQIGPRTLAAVEATQPDYAVRRMLGYRLDAMTRMAGWPAFSKGWAVRVASLLKGQA